MYMNGIINGFWGLFLFFVALYLTYSTISSFWRENKKHFFRFILTGLFMAFVFQFLSGIPGVIAGKQSVIINSEGIESTIKYLLAYGFGFCTLAAFEEFLFRGYFLKRLMKKHSPFLSMLILSSIFSILHFFNYLTEEDLYMNLVNAFLIGIFLSIIAVKDGSLIRCIGFHMSYNVFELLLHSDSKHYKFTRLIYFKQYSSTILSDYTYIMFAILLISTIILMVRNRSIIFSSPHIDNSSESSSIKG